MGLRCAPPGESRGRGRDRTGVVAISDAYFYLENVERPHPIGITESIAEAEATYARVRRTADVIPPLYDPKNLERFPNGL